MAGTAEERLLAELRREARALPPGSRMPSVRELSRRCGLGRAGDPVLVESPTYANPHGAEQKIERKLP